MKTQKYAAGEFIDNLKSDKLHEPLAFEGMVKRER
jgi:hypothetical protein